MIATLLAALAGDEGLVDTLVAAARDASPEVARLPVEESRRHVALLVTAGLAAFRTPADGISYADAEKLGADRAAQGVPIAGLLRGVQAARTRLLEIAVQRGRAAGVADEVLLSAALDFDRYVSAVERHVVEGHHAAERALARGRRDQRDAVLRALLLPGRPPAAAGDVDGLGLRAHLRYRCLVFDVTDPARADALEARLTACGGVFGTVEGRLTGLAVRPPGPVDPAVLLVVGPPLPLSRAAAGYRACVAALAGAARFGGTGRQHALDLAGPAALAAQPELAGLLADELLAALDPADAFHRELAATALSYLDHGQRLDLTAAAVHVHPNTVRYRLRALHERTALPLDDTTVLATLRSWWALRTWLDRA
ncbi:helix-turn-helix domain-containing protein [Dactylosporangium vinaceum]|uniref:Helix-turn-helix domain-containing protein n=1 Tax=Dactylosporangium vinaceum TaxID=53362 RepID=A0ABV5MAS7_9ACTN|nr:helix-turn-helix domain-containing protein [Dactylosporangium vinaceum]UAB92884.1 helix-turn-helix domain-containing protein [Dactylosporangium vinaceum]